MIIEVRARGLRAMREKRGLTQQALANTLGIRCSYVAALESGTVTPGGSLRRAFVAYFGCDLEELFQVEMVHLDEEGLAPESSGSSPGLLGGTKEKRAMDPPQVNAQPSDFQQGLHT